MSINVKGFPFLFLPAELRNEVYLLLAKSRDLALMRTSRSISREMRSIVEGEVPRRVFTRGRWTDDTIWKDVFQRSGRVLNWEVRWTPSRSDSLGYTVDFQRWAALRAESEVERRTCVVFLTTLDCFISAADVLAMGSLAGFKVVVFRHEYPHKYRHAPRFTRAFMRLQVMLEPVLGVGEQGANCAGHYLLFRPGKAMRRECPSGEACGVAFNPALGLRIAMSDIAMTCFGDIPALGDTAVEVAVHWLTVGNGSHWSGWHGHGLRPGRSDEGLGHHLSLITYGASLSVTRDCSFRSFI